MHFEALGIETKGAFGNGSNWRQGGRNKATKDLARNEMGNPLYVNFNQPQYVAPPPGEKVKLKNSGNQGQNKRESNRQTEMLSEFMPPWHSNSFMFTDWMSVHFI